MHYYVKECKTLTCLGSRVVLVIWFCVCIESGAQLDPYLTTANLQSKHIYDTPCTGIQNVTLIVQSNTIIMFSDLYQWDCFHPVCTKTSKVVLKASNYQIGHIRQSIPHIDPQKVRVESGVTFVQEDWV